MALEIAGRQYRVVPQFPFAGKRIDLVIEGQTSSLAVECDGDAVHGLDAYEQDSERQRLLERCRWRFWRIPASEFYANRERALSQLWPLLSEYGIRPIPSTPAAPLDAGVKANETREAGDEYPDSNSNVDDAVVQTGAEVVQGDRQGTFSFQKEESLVAPPLPRADGPPERVMSQSAEAPRVSAGEFSTSANRSGLQLTGSDDAIREGTSKNKLPSEDVTLTEEQSRVVAAIRRSKEPAGVPLISATTGMDPKQLYRILPELARLGVLREVMVGTARRYTIG